MSTSPNLPLGAFITTLGGKRCTALPRTDISTQPSTSTTSTSTSSSIPLSLPSSSASAAQVITPPQIQATQAATTPPPVVPTATSTASSTSLTLFSTLASTPEASSSSAVVVSQPQASVADTSVAASSTPLVTTTFAPTTTPQAVSTQPQSEVLQTESSSAAAFTTIGINFGSTTASSTSQVPGATTTLVAVSGNKSGGNGHNSAAAVAGGVIGGVAIIGLVAFFIWFWRRRILKKRRSTLLTPLSIDPSFGARAEKRAFMNSGNNMGSAARSAQVKAALMTQYGRVRDRFDTLGQNTGVRSDLSHTSSRSVDMNRGNSQYMDNSPAGRKSSNPSAMSPDDGNDMNMTMKERVMDIWGRFRSPQPTAYENKNDIFAARGIGGSMKGRDQNKSKPLSNKPDFLTLLNMDDNELDQEAQRRRLSRARGARGGSVGSVFGGLKFGGDPFSDANAISNNPFSDANAVSGPTVPKPSTYLNEIRRSRGQSVDLNKTYGGLQDLRVVNNSSRPPSGTTGLGETSTYYRDSSASFESFATKRNKFRSDPFDLEPLSHVSDSPLGRPDIPSGNFRGNAYDNIPNPPAAAHTRSGSELSSRYSSGVSDGLLDEWSDPGPDVGPASSVNQGPGRTTSAADAYSPISGSGPYNNGLRRDSGRTSGQGSLKMGYAL